MADFPFKQNVRYEFVVFTLGRTDRTVRQNYSRMDGGAAALDDLFLWLQGEIQHYLPHEIMLAAWGDFRSNLIHHDIVSALIGVRTEHSDVTSLSPLLEGLFNRWLELGRRPYELGAGETGFCCRVCSSMSVGHRVARDAIHA